MTLPSSSSHKVADALSASARHLLSDAHHIMVQGRFEHPDVFESVSYDALLDFIERVREDFASRLTVRGVHPRSAPIPSMQDAAIGRQILQRLGSWPAGREMEVAAWELALSQFLLASPPIHRRA